MSRKSMDFLLHEVNDYIKKNINLLLMGEK